MARITPIGVAVITCATLSAAAGSASAAQATTNQTSTDYAGYTVTSTAHHVSARLAVPTIDCSSVSAVAGQSTGVQLISGSLHLTATIRTYCDGKTAVYAGEFAYPKNGKQILAPLSGMKIKPGEVVELAVSSKHKSGSTASIGVVHQRSGSGQAVAGDALPKAQPYIVTSTMTAGADGEPQTKGTPPADAPVVAGPVSSTAAKFSKVQIDGTVLAKVAGNHAVNWVDTESADIVYVTTSAVKHSTKFSLRFTV